MGKSKRSKTEPSSSSTQEPQKETTPVLQPPGKAPSMMAFLRQGKVWRILGLYFFLAWLLGFTAGIYFPDSFTIKKGLADGVRSTGTFKLITFDKDYWISIAQKVVTWIATVEQNIEADHYAKNPSHPRLFAVLRESIVRERGGYVHHDLGILQPAPCGASRGIGMVRDTYNHCQVRCLPGVAEEKIDFARELQEYQARNETLPMPQQRTFEQEEVFIRVPLNFQMTRAVALNTLSSVIPADVQEKAPLYELDDAALLVLLLAHERGHGRFSRWLPYIATLPLVPSCGYSKALRPYMLDAIFALGNELGLEVHEWPTELNQAGKYADKIVKGLDKDYGAHISTPEGVTSLENIEWALCHVTSRATAGNEKYGALRLVPLVDMINHDISAGGFIELTGKEKLAKGDFVDATEDDAGTFVVRSLRHGKRKKLGVGQELLANYNVPHYTPFDWFTSLGFVPRERRQKWKKVDPVLPPLRRDLQHDRSS